MKKFLASALMVPFSLPSVSASIPDAVQSSWKPSILLGCGTTNIDQTQNLRLADTPSPGLTNHYSGSGRLYGAGLVGLAIEKEFAMSPNLGAAGFELDYLRNNDIGGMVQPMINVSSDFDELKYSYDIHSLLLQATAKLIRQRLLHQLGGYLQIGLGAAVNRLSNYQESSPDTSSAAPMLSPFGGQNTVSPALSAGLGLTYDTGSPNTRVSFGYRYVYAGRGSLTSPSIQQTNNAFSLSSISYHFLMLTLTV